MLGTVVSHYKILEKLGEGGMGVVYKAQDTRLNRLVALKFLPRGFVSSSEDVARFEREAKAISTLNHPHIATIYDIDEFDGQKFIVLELIEGGTLKERLRKQQLTISEALDYAIQIAEGLAHAHRRGIIHRDLKTANILLTDDGQVKIADFGLAKLQDATKVTQIGSTMGTAGYMSPEQALGEDADQRSDMFSFGVILYEMLTGEPPFKGQNAASLLFEIVNTPHKPIKDVRAEVPVDLQLIINKILEKDSEKRYQQTEGLLSDLQALKQQVGSGTGKITRVVRFVDTRKVLRVVVPGLIGIAVLVVVLFYLMNPSKTTSRDRKSVAVLPLKNLSDDKEQEYFSDGITEDIIAQLSKIADLKVIARTSVMHYKNSDKTLKEIANDLNVATILEGSVRRAGNQIRIVANLVDASTEQTLWTQTYDKDLAQIFAIQSDVAQRIAGGLVVKLSSREKALINKEPTQNTQAYQLYLQGRYFRTKYQTFDDLNRSVQILAEAISLDSASAELWAEVSMAQIDLANMGFVNVDSAYKQALLSADRAISLDSNCANAYKAMGWIQRSYQWDWIGAEKSFGKAVLIEPRNSSLLLGAAVLASTLGDEEKAIELLRNALEMDPLSVGAWVRLAKAYTYTGDLKQSASSYRKLIELNPQYMTAHLGLGRALLGQHMYEPAMSEIRQETDEAFRAQGMALVNSAIGDRKKSAEALNHLIEGWSKNSAFQIAEVYAYRGEKDKAFEWLERAYQQRDAGLSSTLGDPLLEKIADDPRYIAFLDKMKLPHPVAGSER